MHKNYFLLILGFGYIKHWTMPTIATTVKEYIDNLPYERKKVIKKLRSIIKKNLPKGFKETISYGMIGYVIPHSIYPDGYHCSPELPLPFISLASQKNFIAVYHMGIYADPKLMKWFTTEYPKYVSTKLDMGKSCIRFKKMETIPYDLIGELVTKMTTDDWINLYEKNIKKK
jgi:uncharacterized protein YdhG (YjbR/CyaY superfamily)